MAIEFRHNGRSWRADTPEEAIALRRQLEAEDRLLARGETREITTFAPWSVDEAADLLETSGPLQKRFLQLLYESQQFVKGEEILKALKIRSNEALAGVLSGLSKQLKKINRRTSDLYSVDVEWGKKGKVRQFRMSDGCRWAIQQLGWDDKWTAQL
jgi:hypothetical protein